MRAGFLAQREHATSLTNAQVLPVDGTGTPTSDQPIGIVNGADQVGWLYGIYLQDEWKLTPTVTLNYGARFDAIDGNTQENQLSPRINVVWQPNPILTAHAGLRALLHAAAAGPGEQRRHRLDDRHDGRARRCCRTIR